MSTDLLNFEHPLVLLFCFVLKLAVLDFVTTMGILGIAVKLLELLEVSIPKTEGKLNIRKPYDA